MPEIRKPYRTKLRVFEGSFHDAAGVPTTTVRWSTRSVSLSDGPVEGRLRVTPRTSYGIGEAISAVPPRAQATLELDNFDHALSPYLVGTLAGPEQEYRGDSLLNLKGKLFAVYLLADGTEEKHALTPTLAVSGSPTFTETGVVVPMATDDAPILGRPRPIVRVRDLLNAELVLEGSTHFFPTINSTEAMGPTDWGYLQNEFLDNLDAVIPYAYGRTALPLIGVHDAGRLWIAFASKHQPKIDDFTDWRFSAGADAAGHDARFERAMLGTVWAPQVRYTDEEGEQRDVWLVILERIIPVGMVDWETIYALPPEGNPLSAGTGRGPATPARVAQWIVEDLSEAGLDSAHTSSFFAAHKAIPLPNACGGLVTGDANIGGILTHIGSPWALAWWIGLDDRLHVGVPGQWTAADRAALTDPATPRIAYPADFAGGGRPGSYSETIPANPEQRGSAARKVSIEWSGQQQQAWPGDELPRWAPGVTELPVPKSAEARLSGAWVFPPAAIDVLASHAMRRSFPTRRLTLTLHDWVGVLERGAICLLSLPTAGAGAYTSRVVRLEATADDSREYVVARFEDMGPTAAQRPALYDTIANWDSVVGGATLTVNGVSVIASAPVFDPEKHVGMHLHTPGAAPVNRAIARRIVAVADSTHLTVEYAFPVLEVLPPSPPGTPVLHCGWAILESIETKPTDTYLCAADETTGEFRDGSPGFTVAAG